MGRRDFKLFPVFGGGAAGNAHALLRKELGDLGIVERPFFIFLADDIKNRGFNRFP